jgi:hypothetical protein
MKSFRIVIGKGDRGNVRRIERQNERFFTAMSQSKICRWFLCCYKEKELELPQRYVKKETAVSEEILRNITRRLENE